MAGETALGTAVVPIRATLDSLDEDLSKAKAKAEAGAKAAAEAAAKAWEKSLTGRLSAAVQQMGSIGQSLAKTLGAPLEALGRVPIGAVTASVQGLGSALAIPSRAAGVLASTLGRISAAPIGVLKGAVGGLASAFTTPIRAVGALSTALGTIGLATLGIRAVVDAAKGLYGALGVKIASDINESWNKVQVVFGKNAKVIDDWSKTTANALGLSRSEALDTAGTYGNLFKTLGISEKALPKMSKDVIKLAADLGSFNNVPTPQVLEAIRSGLVGESEPLRQFGINLNEAAVAEEAVRLGLAKSTKEVSEQAKVQARLSLITKQSATAQNDFANTSSGMANASKRISAGLSDIQAAIGEKVLPVVAPLIASFADALPKALDKVTPLLDTFGRVLQDVFSGNWSGVLDTIGEQIRLAFGQDALNTFRTIVVDVASVFQNNVIPTFNRVKDILGSLFAGDPAGAFEKLKSAIGSINLSGLLKFGGDVAGKVTTWLGEQWKSIKWGTVWGAASTAVGTAISTALDIGASVLAWLSGVWQGIPWSLVWGTVKTLVGNAIGTALDIGSSVLGWIKTTWQNIPWNQVWATVQSVVGATLKTGLNIVSDVLGWLKDTWDGINWTEVWKTVTGLGAGLLQAGLDMTKEFGLWLHDQIAGADPKLVWSGLPPRPTTNTGPSTGGAAIPMLNERTPGPAEQGQAYGDVWFQNFANALNSKPTSGPSIDLGPLGATIDQEWGKYKDSVDRFFGFVSAGFAIYGGQWATRWQTISTQASGTWSTISTQASGTWSSITTTISAETAKWSTSISTEVAKWGPILGGGLTSAWQIATGVWNSAASFSTWLGGFLNGTNPDLQAAITGFFTGFKADWDTGWAATGLTIDLGPTLASIGASFITFKTETWDPFWTGVSTTVSNIIQGITDAWNNSTIGQVVNNITWMIGQGFQALYDLLLGHSIIPDIINGIQAAWDGLTAPLTTTVNGIRDGVSGAFNTLKTNVTTAIEGARDSIKGAVNSMIGFLNSLIGAWNGLAFKIPGFSIDLPSVDVPGVGRVGGGNLGWGGVNVSTPDLAKIPTLDTGGLVTKPTLAMLAMNRQPEVVIPLSAMPSLRAPSDRYSPAVAALGTGSTGGGGNVTKYITIQVSGAGDPNAVARKVYELLTNDRDAVLSGGVA